MSEIDKLRAVLEPYENGDGTYLFCGRHPFHGDEPACDCNSLTGCKRVRAALSDSDSDIASENEGLRAELANSAHTIGRLNHELAAAVARAREVSK